MFTAIRTCIEDSDRVTHCILSLQLMPNSTVQMIIRERIVVGIARSDYICWGHEAAGDATRDEGAMTADTSTAAVWIVVDITQSLNMT